MRGIIVLITLSVCLQVHAHAQYLDAECGIDALHRVFQACHLSIGYEEIKSRCHVTSIGCSMDELRLAAISFGFQATGKIVTYESLLESEIPCVAYINQNHYIAVLSSEGDEIIAYDIKGESRYAKKDFMKVWNGEILSLSPRYSARQASKAASCESMRPRIHIEKDIFHVGKILSSDSRYIEIPIMNDGNEALIIRQVKSSCPCVSVSDQIPVTLAPYSTFKLKTRIDGSKLNGKLNAQLLIYSNDPSTPKILVSIIGEISKEYTWAPKKVNFGEVYCDSAVERNVVIRSASPLNIKSVMESTGKLETRCEEIFDSRIEDGLHRYLVNMKVKANTSPGVFNTTLHVYTSDKEDALIAIPVTGELKGDLVVKPACLSFGIIKSEISHTQLLMVSNRKHKSFKITCIENSIEQLDFQIVDKRPDSVAIKVTLSPRCDNHSIMPKTIQSVLIFYTDYESYPIIKLPVIAMFQ